MNTKKCCKCQLELSTTQFYKQSGRSPDGFGYICKKCDTIQKNIRYHKNPKKYNSTVYKWKSEHKEEVARKLQIYKDKIYRQCKDIKKRIATDYGCFLCKESRPDCLDFHHILPETKIKDIGKCYNLASLFTELPKCMVLCSNCHRLYHKNIIQLPNNITSIDISKYVPENYTTKKNKFHTGIST